MKEFLISLYENPSFPIYLGSIILALVIAFFVIFFLGKRDQKNIEKTQRLEAIHDTAFQETTVPVQMDVAPQVVTNEQLNNDLNNTISETPTQHIQMSTVEDDNPLNVYNINPTPVQTPVVEQPVVAPVVEEVQQVVETPVVEQPVVQEPVIETPVIEQPVVAPTPVVEPVVEAPVIEQPIVQEPAIEQPIIEQPVIETPIVEEQPVQNNEVIFPTIENNYETIDQAVDNKIDNLQNIASSISNELDSLEAEQNKYYNMTSEPVIEQPIVQEPVIEQPIIETPVIEQPVVEEYQPAHARIEETPVVEQPVVAPVIEEVQPVIKSEPVKTNYSTNNVFSSVYAPPRVEQPVVEDTDDEELELPRLK